MTTPTATPAAAADSVVGLAEARRHVVEQFDPAEPITRVALDLIECAAEVVHQLPGGDLESAYEALGSARAAVVSATYALRRIQDSARTGVAAAPVRPS